MFNKKKTFTCTCGYTIDTCPVVTSQYCPRYALYDCPVLRNAVNKLEERVDSMSQATLKKQCETILEQEQFGEEM